MLRSVLNVILKIIMCFNYFLMTEILSYDINSPLLGKTNVSVI